RVQLQDVQRAGPAAARRRVHQDHGLVAVEQGVGQVQAADAEVDHAHLGRRPPPRQPPDDLDAEGVVAQADVADAGDQDARLLHNTLLSSAWGDSPSSFQATRSNVARTRSFSRSVPPRAITGRMLYSAWLSRNSPARRTPSEYSVSRASIRSGRVTPR